MTDELSAWASRQPIFLTGSAPTYGSHVNVSPKGLTDSHFAFLSSKSCAYIDRAGSGCETISHTYENGRLCIMFMSFGPSPRILRIYCHANVIEWDHPGFQDLLCKITKGKVTALGGARGIILCDIWQTQTSCGFGVPLIKKAYYMPQEKPPVQAEDEKPDHLNVFEERTTLDDYWSKPSNLDRFPDFLRKNSVCSLDGLPGLRSARRDSGQVLWWVDTKVWMKRVAAQRDAVAVGFLLASMFYFALGTVLGLG